MARGCDICMVSSMQIATAMDRSPKLLRRNMVRDTEEVRNGNAGARTWVAPAIEDLPGLAQLTLITAPDVAPGENGGLSF